MRPLTEIGKEVSKATGYYTHSEVKAVGCNRFQVKLEVLDTNHERKDITFNYMDTVSRKTLFVRILEVSIKTVKEMTA